MSIVGMDVPTSAGATASVIEAPLAAIEPMSRVTIVAAAGVEILSTPHASVKTKKPMPRKSQFANKSRPAAHVEAHHPDVAA